MYVTDPQRTADHLYHFLTYLESVLICLYVADIM